MSGWRHVGLRDDGMCTDCQIDYIAGVGGLPFCTTPTPDPSERWNEDGMCENCQTPWKCNGPHDYTPTHPTRCTCGHAIEPKNKEDPIDPAFDRAFDEVYRR